jgi:hypothetical protein
VDMLSGIVLFLMIGTLIFGFCSLLLFLTVLYFVSNMNKWEEVQEALNHNHN